MSHPDPSSAEFFDAMYRRAPDADPWAFGTAPYELARYRAIVRSLPGQRFQRAFEPGCSIGVLTQQLAALCDEVEACDLSSMAVHQARQRCAEYPGVTIECAALTGYERWEQYDLVVLSEIGYYFTAAAWQAIVDRMVAGMRCGTLLVASHWLGQSTDHKQHGDAVHNALQHPLLRPVLSERYEGFRLQQWIRADPIDSHDLSSTGTLQC